MGKLAKRSKTGADGIIGFLAQRLRFDRNPYTTQEKVKKQEETQNIYSATERIKDETEKVKAEQKFEEATTKYISELGKYGQVVGGREIETNKQKAALLGTAGDIRESEAKVAIAQGSYEERKEQALLQIRSKYNVGAFK